MYTKQSADNRHAWAILDPDGDYICTVVTEEGADAILVLILVGNLPKIYCQCLFLLGLSPKDTTILPIFKCFGINGYTKASFGDGIRMKLMPNGL